MCEGRGGWVWVSGGGGGEIKLGDLEVYAWLFLLTHFGHHKALPRLSQHSICTTIPVNKYEEMA